MCSKWLTSLSLVCFVFTFSEGQLCDQDDVRLVGGPNEFEGRLEICYGGEWKQVCRSRGWDTLDGVVVCRQLGHSEMGLQLTPLVYNGEGFHGTGDGPGVQIEFPACEGTENTLLECPRNSTSNNSGCSTNDNVVILCPDPVCSSDPENVRLVGGPDGDSSTEGRVEICSPSNLRRGICNTSWDVNDARVVCRELGLLSDDTEPQTMFEDGRYLGAILTNVHCDGNEEELPRCGSGQTDQTDPRIECSLAGVRCPGQPSISTQTPPVTVMTTTRMETEVSTTEETTTSETLTEQTTTSETLREETSTTLMETDSSTTIEPPGTQASFPSEAATEDTTTSGVASESPDSSTTTLAIGVGLGVVGVLLLVVAVLLVVLVCILVGRKHNKKVTFEAQEAIKPNKYSHNSEATKTISVTAGIQPTTNNGLVYEETQRELVNPIYKTNHHELSNETELQTFPTDYAELEEVRPKEATRTLPTDPPTYYSTPTPPILEKPNGLHEYSEPEINVATTDARGYASLESPHLYDDTQHPSGLGGAVPSPYETPLSPNGSANTQSSSGTSQEKDQPPTHVYEVPSTDFVEECPPTPSVSHPYATLERP